MTNTLFPKYVKLRGSCLRKVKDKYYRDAGHWEIGFKVVKLKLISINQNFPWLNKVELIEVTEKEWREDNKGYV